MFDIGVYTRKPCLGHPPQSRYRDMFEVSIDKRKFDLGVLKTDRAPCPVKDRAKGCTVSTAPFAKFDPFLFKKKTDGYAPIKKQLMISRPPSIRVRLKIIIMMQPNSATSETSRLNTE